MTNQRQLRSVTSRVWTDRDAVCDASDVEAPGTGATHRCEHGNARLLLAASHSLRQPLQTLSLLHGVLAQQLADTESVALINKLDDTIEAMSGMLSAFLDIAHLEAGEVHPEIQSFPIDLVLQKLRKEFTYLAKSKGLSLDVVASNLSVRSDPRLLTQMMRTLLSDAIKCSERERLLLGCRRSATGVRIELWDGGYDPLTGQLEIRFDELSRLRHQDSEWDVVLDLSYARKIGEALGHKLKTRNGPGNGPIFTIEAQQGEAIESAPRRLGKVAKARQRRGTILIVEDDAAVRDSLELLLTGEGHQIIAAADAAEVAARQASMLTPDVIIADYNLPGGKTGLEVIKSLRSALHRQMPAIVVSGGFTTEALQMVTAEGCEYLHKPTDIKQLTRRIEDLLPALMPQGKCSASNPTAQTNQDSPLTIFIVDDDVTLLESMRDMLQHHGHAIELHKSAESFLSAYRPQRKGCVIVDSMMPGISGLELIERLKSENRDLPVIMVTGHGDMSMAVKAMKAGALDFLEKPVKRDTLLEGISLALAEAHDIAKRSGTRARAAATLAALTPRMRDVMDLVVAGVPNKKIAATLKINQRTVEAHRAAVMKRTGAASLADLVRLVIRASEPLMDASIVKNG